MMVLGDQIIEFNHQFNHKEFSREPIKIGNQCETSKVFGTVLDAHYHEGQLTLITQIDKSNIVVSRYSSSYGV